MTKPFDSAADLVDAPHVGTKLKPRNAATLILVRRDGDEPQVLMGRRAEGHVFMASKWVFPGGRVDSGDITAPAATELRPEVIAHPALGASKGAARGLGICAVRETFEEAGLMLAKPATYAKPPSRTWRDFAEKGVAADLGALSFIARAITPPGRARRFDARFFMAEASALLHMQPETGDRELDEIAWLTVEQLTDLDLPQITRFVLREVVGRLQDEIDDVPFVRMVRGQHSVERF
ncbi:MAG TPA: NUDIX domain-containing protein [Caulobacteraceae bacterium]|nr:NUDIX domain-containing protein [Caulobacteraceae bacterium]